MLRKKPKETWWESTNEEQNAALKSPAEAAEAVIEQPATDTPQPGKEKKPKRKHRWDWWDAAGDLLEVVIDIIGDLFD